jgi:hypothetical protein
MLILWAGAPIMRTSLVLAMFLALVCQGKDTNEPATLRYIRRGEFISQGADLSGTVFWVTNHTTKRIDITLSAVEVKVGSNWITQSSIIEGLMFQPVGRTEPAPHGAPVSPRGDVDPHGAGYAYTSAQFAKLPPGTTWRVRAVVQPMLTGLADRAARIKAYPGDLLDQLHGRNTNYSSKPSTFSKRLTYWGKGIEIVSPEVLEQ